MTTRKPPRLATWLLSRIGLSRQNPPLAGDLLEEFGSGRSAAWYWRQTLSFIFTGLAGRARLFWRCLTAQILGWVAQIVVAFSLWRSHAPSQLHGLAEGLVAIVVLIVLFLLRLVLAKRRSEASEVAAKERMLHLWDGSRFDKVFQLLALAFFAGWTFIYILAMYCVIAVLCPIPLSLFVLFQAEMLLLLVKEILLNPNPGLAVMFTTLK